MRVLVMKEKKFDDNSNFITPFTTDSTSSSNETGFTLNSG